MAESVASPSPPGRISPAPPQSPSPQSHLVPKMSLYVGDLHPEVTEDELMGAFKKMGTVASLRICRDTISKKSLGYAYVNFASQSDAARALACLNHTKIKGKPLRIMWSHRDPLPRKTGTANLFLKNLDPSVTGARLQGIFCKYGTILSCKVAEENGKSKGFGFVQFESEESAMAALTALHDTELEGKKLYVSKFVKKSERNASRREDSFTNLYVKNLSEDWTEDVLRDKFSEFGKVRSAVIMKDHTGKPKGFGFVDFELPQDAWSAVEALNGAPFGSKNLFVGRAQKKSEREGILKRELEHLFCAGDKLNASNLYVKNIDVSIDDHKLQEYFSDCGQVTSAKVMRDDKGMSKGFGFVSFSCPDEAKKALATLNGSNFQGRFIYVAIAQRKEDRQRLLQSYHSYTTPSPFLPSWGALPLPSRPPSYVPPPYPPSNLVSYMSSCQPSTYQHYSSNVGGLCPLATQSYQQTYVPYSTTYTTSQATGHNLNFRKPRGQNFASRKQGNSSKGPTRNSTAAFSSGSYKRNLGELLYPLVQNLQPEGAAKITGMLLDTKKSDIMKLINSPNSLAVEVGRAAQVLRDSNAWNGANSGVAFPVKSARCLSY